MSLTAGLKLIVTNVAAAAAAHLGLGMRQKIIIGRADITLTNEPSQRGSTTKVALGKMPAALLSSPSSDILAL